MRLLKRLWPITSALMLALLAFKACAQMVPYNIEPERVRPQAKIELPKIQTTPDSVDYFFEPNAAEKIKPGEPYPVVHIRIPKAPYFEKNSSNGPKRAYELYIHMFYPNFSGLGDPENTECITRVAEGKYGWCRREMVVGFGFSFMLPKTTQYDEFKKFQSDIAHGFIHQSSQKSRYNDLALAGIQDNGLVKETYYVGKDETGQPAYVFRCSEGAVSPSCDTRFRASKSPYIFIDTTFVLDLLPQWKEVISATRSKVDSMIVKTYNLQTKE